MTIIETPGRNAGEAGGAGAARASGPAPPPVDLGRLRSRGSDAAEALVGASTVGAALATVVAGRLAAAPDARLLAVFASLVLGGVLLENGALVLWAAKVDRAEGALRSDLVGVVLAQPVPALADAGGPEAVVGHRGVRLSGGQVQRLALARALACGADLLLADDVSSALDARTELELWASLRARGSAVLGATSKRAALRLADRVVVLDGGRAVASGPWHELEPRFAHLAG